ncbi:hypothetical protein M8J75_008777 [Diaphorina citri]|nr:hypothetical protein M8J75_008777 [Diaphorina citri]
MKGTSTAELGYQNYTRFYPVEILSLEKICRKTAEEKHRKILIRANLYFLIKTVFCLCRSVSAMVACGNVERFNKPHISTFSITDINGLKMV